MQLKRMEAGKGIFEKKEKEFEGERSRSRMEEKERGWRCRMNLGRFMKELTKKE